MSDQDLENNYIDTPTTCSECSYQDEEYEQNMDNDVTDVSDVIDQNNFIFNQDEEYIFVNQMLNLIYGSRLPSYAYYDSNTQVNNFWNSLEIDDFFLVYDYLVNEGYMLNDNTLDDEQIRYQVLAFVRSYFISTNNDYENNNLF